jgi:cbb3-type cytochrome oxidase subunit 3
MYKNVLQSIDNVAIWPVISLIIFFIFFLILLWWVFTADKNFINKMKNLPLNDQNKDQNQTASTTNQML